MSILTTREAVVRKMDDLLKERNMNLHQLSRASGVLYDTLKKLRSRDNNSVTLAIVIQIASGFNMTLSEFVDDPMFSEDNLK